MADPKDPTVTTTKGAPGPDVEPGGAPAPINPRTGQQEAYWVLTEEERAKGFVRPVREAYVHVGVPGVEHARRRPLTAEEKESYPEAVLFEQYPESELPKTGRFLTDRQLEGCGMVTRMSREIAESFARNPSFYGSTFCVGCREHLPVEEFRWDGTDECVGN